MKFYHELEYWGIRNQTNQQLDLIFHESPKLSSKAFEERVVKWWKNYGTYDFQQTIISQNIHLDFDSKIVHSNTNDLLNLKYSG